MSLEEANRHNAEIFQRQNAAFMVPMFSAGTFDKVTRTKFQGQQTLLRTAGLELELKLGKDTPATSGKNGWRTFSRYVLKTSTGRKLAEAESLLSNYEGSEGNLGVSVFSDAAKRTVVIMEHRYGTGPRYILFNAPTETAGTVRCVDVPLRVEADLSPMHLSLPNILGIREGNIFLQEDGAIFVFPLNRLKEVTQLEFTLG